MTDVELADTSAWTNAGKSVEADRAFSDAVGDGAVAICPPVTMELLWTVRDASEFVARRDDLDALPQFATDPAVWARAIDVFQKLAEHGPLHHRRVGIVDLLVAATAELAGVPVCHYDRDFETIAEVTGQPVRAIAPLGSL
jgi:predicted nucleic acid-binding protein